MISSDNLIPCPISFDETADLRETLIFHYLLEWLQIRPVKQISVEVFMFTSKGKEEGEKEKRQEGRQKERERE